MSKRLNERLAALSQALIAINETGQKVKLRASQVKTTQSQLKSTLDELVRVLEKNRISRNVTEAKVKKGEENLSQVISQVETGLMSAEAAKQTLRTTLNEINLSLNSGPSEQEYASTIRGAKNAIADLDSNNLKKGIAAKNTSAISEVPNNNNSEPMERKGGMKGGFRYRTRNRRTKNKAPRTRRVLSK
jgi:ABC-type transporter Mla subunit MlaD